MMDRLDVIKGITGQRVYFYPQEGRPTATPSVAILDEYGTTITAASTTGVTLDPVSTTISAAASKGVLSITLTSVAGVEVCVPEAPGPAIYLLLGADGYQQRVRLTSLNTSTKIATLEEPLEHDFASAASFLGIRFYRTLSAAEVSTLRELCRARATYAANGLNYQSDVTYDVVLVPLPNPLTYHALKDRRPDLAAQESAATRGSDFATFRRQAWDQVRKGIRKACLPDEGRGRPALLRTPDDVEEWGWAEFDLIAHRNGIKVLHRDWSGPEAMEHLEGRISRLKAESLASMAFYDIDEDDSRGDDDIRPMPMDLIR
jgi:hypothetical protein